MISSCHSAVVALFCQTRKDGEWHNVCSLCISKMWLFAFFLVERTLKQVLRGRRQVAKGTKENYTIMPFSTTRLSCVSSSSLLFPSSPPYHHHPPSSPHHPPLSPPPSEGLEGLKAFQPLLQGPVGQALGCVHTYLASSSR